MMVERRKVDLNQKNRTIRLWLTILSIAIVLVSFIATGAVKLNQVENNKRDIEMLESKQEKQGEILIRIDENVKNIKEDIIELKNRR